MLYWHWTNWKLCDILYTEGKRSPEQKTKEVIKMKKRNEETVNGLC